MRIRLTGAMARALAAQALIVFDLAFGPPGATAQVQIPALPPPAVVDAKTAAYGAVTPLPAIAVRCRAGSSIGPHP
jgi:hypothetical protein